MSLNLFIRPRIAVVEVYGIIGSSVRTGEYIRIFNRLRDDPSVRAVVLDINSPGGSVSASDYLHTGAAKLAAKKPVIAFIRGVGASGAYLLSCAANRTVAIPTAVVGSIGVISVRPVLRDLLQRLGIEVFITKSGPFKDMGYMYREPTEEERRKEQAIVDEFHSHFVEVVAEARHLDPETVRQFATGEIFTARQAHTMGLLDELGDLDRAVDIAMEMSKAPRRIAYVRPRLTLRQRLLGATATSLAHAVIGELEQALSVSWPNYYSHRRR